MPDVEVPAGRRGSLEDRRQRLDAAERVDQVLDHHAAALGGGVLAQPGDGLGVAAVDLGPRAVLEAVALRVDVDQPDVGLGEHRELAAVLLAGHRLDPVELGGDGQVVGGVPHRGRPELVQRLGERGSLDRPGPGRLESHVEGLEAQLAQPPQLGHERPARVVHGGAAHRPHPRRAGPGGVRAGH